MMFIDNVRELVFFYPKKKLIPGHRHVEEDFLHLHLLTLPEFFTPQGTSPLLSPEDINLLVKVISF